MKNSPIYFLTIAIFILGVLFIFKKQPIERHDAYKFIQVNTIPFLINEETGSTWRLINQTIAGTGDNMIFWSPIERPNNDQEEAQIVSKMMKEAFTEQASLPTKNKGK